MLDKCSRCEGAHPIERCKKQRRIFFWNCGEPGHIARQCESESKLDRETACTSGFPEGMKALPKIDVTVGEKVVVRALVDPGRTKHLFQISSFTALVFVLLSILALRCWQLTIRL